VELTPVPYALALPGLYTQQNATSPNLIDGYSGNTVLGGAIGATMGGGGSSGAPNTAGDYATIGGGNTNTANGYTSTIGGGVSNTASGNLSTVGGGEGNRASAQVSTIGGGNTNTASGDYSTVGGGAGNTAGNWHSTVGGGLLNTASGVRSTVGGGYGNVAGKVCVGGTNDRKACQSDTDCPGGSCSTATPDYASVGGGIGNTASGEYSTVGGGRENAASGYQSTIPGGIFNEAGGDYSFAAGFDAKVRTAAQVGGGDTDGDQGTFIWADSIFAEFQSTGPNQFLVRASGGTRIYSDASLTAGVTLAAGGSAWAAVSDRNLKENFTEVDKPELLDRLAAIPVTTWKYKSQDGSIRHIGPMAQDFYAAFGVGEEDTKITTIDADGVVLAAIQGLYQIVQDKDCRIEELQTETESLREANAALAIRLAAIEALIARSSNFTKEGAR
jgi:hypothetical protein